MENDAISRSAALHLLDQSGLLRGSYGALTRHAITLLPALDVQPVVRCGDCKWYDSAFYACSKCGVCVNRDFYCADGARMDAEEDAC